MGQRFGIVLACCVAGMVSQAHAHPITIDGNTSEWMARSPAGGNLGIVARDSVSRGELIWSDPRLDARTDLVAPGSPEPVDLLEFAVTGDATNLYLRVRAIGDLIIIGPRPQIQIAIDLDRVSMSGTPFFAGFADTQVNAAAEWEFLIQTQVTTGLPQVRVLDTSFTSVGTGAIFVTSTEAEIAIPWTLLGLAGPPPVARFTVAMFREVASGDTVNLPGTSNALDVITDYGDPEPVAFPNTFAEVSDGVVDYFFDVYFEPSGEVYAPLAITRIVHSPTSAEMVEVRNQTPGALDLADFFLGDEETPNGGEGMEAFPSSVLAAGATFVVARNGADYFGYYGTRADAEWASADAVTPDMIGFSNWSTGSVNVTAGDEILVLGVGHVILDVATWGAGAYAGIIDIASFGTGETALRTPVTQDTDDCSVDFTVLASCLTASDCTAACTTCAVFVCAPIASGSACDDGDMCTTGEACDGSGACGGGSVTSCDDANPCTADACDSTTGCSNASVAAGTSCADADMCDGAEICNGSGVCVAGTPLTCDDSNDCTADSCVAATGCMNAAESTGTGCDDGDACTIGDNCDGAGVCVSTGIDPICIDAGVPDAGVPDAGIADAGSDAGTMDTDAGTMDTDAGMMDTDAGMMAMDATTGGDGSVGPDAGGDAGTGAMDGGCSCRAGGGGRPAGAWLGLLALLALSWRRRR